VPGPTSADLSEDQIKMVKAFLSKLNDISGYMKNINPSSVNLEKIKPVIINTLDLFDIIIGNKYSAVKVNKNVDGLIYTAFRPPVTTSVTAPVTEAQSAGVSLPKEVIDTLFKLKKNTLISGNFVQRLQQLLTVNPSDPKSKTDVQNLVKSIRDTIMSKHEQIVRKSIGTNIADYRKSLLSETIRGGDLFVRELTFLISDLTMLIQQLRNVKKPSGSTPTTPSSTKEGHVIITSNQVYKFGNGKWYHYGGTKNPSNDGKEVVGQGIIDRLNNLAKTQNDSDKLDDILKSK
jgi:hypothetical protein